MYLCVSLRQLAYLVTYVVEGVESEQCAGGKVGFSSVMANLSCQRDWLEDRIQNCL